MAESNMALFKRADIIKLIRLNYFQSEAEWSESVFEWIWEKITRCLNPRWQWLNPTWQNSRWLPSSSWVRMNEWSFLCIMAESKMARIQDGCHHQVEWEWMSEVFFCAKWLNPRWQNSRWLTSSNWVRMNEFDSDWISLSQSFWVKCKMPESKMAEFKIATIIRLIRLN